jgi:nicotinamide mononucleotide adenylyltransferase
MEYGVYLGRFQPFHNGHNATIQEIILAGLRPIIIMGSIEKIDERNPLSFEERVDLIRKIYPGIIIIPVKDYENWDEWYEKIIEELSFFDGKKHIFSFRKESDFSTFTFKGKLIKNCHYLDIFKDDFTLVDVCEYTCKLGSTIDATKVRNCKEYGKENIDARIFIELEKKGFWE